MKVFLHVHTSFSFDGEISIEEVAKGAKAMGAGVIFINEHPRGMTLDTYSELVQRARSLSDESLVIVPGLEIRLPEGGELLAVGVDSLPKSRNTCSLADEIHEQGGLTILSHPDESRGLSSSALSKLDGIEVWNGLHDSKYFPNGVALALLRKARHYNRNIFGCCGLDLHTREGWFPLFLQLDARAQREPIVALRSRAFAYGRMNLMFRAEWTPSLPRLAALTTMTLAYKALALGLRATGCSLPRPLSRAMRKSAGER